MIPRIESLQTNEYLANELRKVEEAAQAMHAKLIAAQESNRDLQALVNKASGETFEQMTVELERQAEKIAEQAGEIIKAGERIKDLEQQRSALMKINASLLRALPSDPISDADKAT